MSITCPEELAALRAAGAIVRRMLEAMKLAVRPGVETAELDEVGVEEGGGQAGGKSGEQGADGRGMGRAVEVVVGGLAHDEGPEQGDANDVAAGSVVISALASLVIGAIIAWLHVTGLLED